MKSRALCYHVIMTTRAHPDNCFGIAFVYVLHNAYYFHWVHSYSVLVNTLLGRVTALNPDPKSFFLCFHDCKFHRIGDLGSNFLKYDITKHNIRK